MNDPYNPNDQSYSASLYGMSSYARTGTTMFPTSSQARDHAQVQAENMRLSEHVLRGDRTANAITEAGMAAFNDGVVPGKDTDAYQTLHATMGFLINSDMISSMSGRGNLNNLMLGAQMTGVQGGFSGMSGGQGEAMTKAIYDGLAGNFMSDNSGFARESMAHGMNFTELGDIQTALSQRGAFTGSVEGEFSQGEDGLEFELGKDFEQKMNSRLSSMSETMATLKNIFGGQPMSELMRRAEEITGLSTASNLDSNMINQRLMDIQAVGKANNMTNIQGLYAFEHAGLQAYDMMGVGDMGGAFQDASRRSVLGGKTRRDTAKNIFETGGNHLNATTLEEAARQTQADNAALLMETPELMLGQYLSENVLVHDSGAKAEFNQLSEELANARNQGESNEVRSKMRDFFQEKTGKDFYTWSNSLGGPEGVIRATSQKGRAEQAKQIQAMANTRIREEIRTDVEDLYDSDSQVALTDMLLDTDSTTRNKIASAMATFNPETGDPEELEKKLRGIVEGPDAVMMGSATADGLVSNAMAAMQAGGGSGFASTLASINADERYSHFTNEADRAVDAAKSHKAMLDEAVNLDGSVDTFVTKNIKDFLGGGRSLSAEDIVNTGILTEMSQGVVDNADLSEGALKDRKFMEDAMDGRFFKFQEGNVKEEDLEAMEEVMVASGRGRELSDLYSNMGLDLEDEDRKRKLAEKANSAEGMVDFHNELQELGFNVSTTRHDADGEDAYVTGVATDEFVRMVSDRGEVKVSEKNKAEALIENFGVDEEFADLAGNLMSGEESESAKNEFSEYLSGLVGDKEIENAQSALGGLIKAKNQEYEEAKQSGADKETTDRLKEELRNLKDVKNKSSQNEYIGRLTIVEDGSSVIDVSHSGGAAGGSDGRALAF